MPEVIDAKEIIQLQKDCIIRWKETGVEVSAKNFYQLVEENHSFNYQLWMAEDKARRDDKGFEYVYHAKRSIDGFNQQRNNRMEMMDEWLFYHLKPSQAADCPVHSETPGMIIDRLSILALKAYHMKLQTERKEVNEAHRESCQEKLSVILKQLDQLANCLNQLLNDIANQKRSFRVYHQFKMYNDPSLNPELYEQ